MRYRNLIIQKNYYIIGMNYIYSSANKSRGEQKKHGKVYNRLQTNLQPD